MRPQSLAIIGLGAIGGSIAWQARRAGVPSVRGYSPDRSDAVQAVRAGAVHDIADSLARAVVGADFVVLAAPPAVILTLLDQIGSHLAPGALVTDVASIKVPIVTRAVAAGLTERFAGSHPFAGTHVSGFEGATPDRLRGAMVYVCSTGAMGESAAREVMDFWQGILAAQPIRIDAGVHDAQLGWTSHLPQAVATALARTLASEPSLRGASLGTGARDTTRLAASPADMWLDIFLLNRDAVCQALARAEGEMAELRRLIEDGDRTGLRRFLEQAASYRRQLDGETGRG